MPFYMPWLSVATAVLAVISTLLANNRCAWFLPLYVSLLVAVLLMHFAGIIKLTRTFIFLLSIPILVFIHADSSVAHIIDPRKNQNLQFKRGQIVQIEANNFIDQIRQRITNLHLCYLGPQKGSLLASMVLGNRAAKLDKAILNAFRKIGLCHIVAASGFNLTIVTTVTYWLLRKLFAQRLIVTLLVCVNVSFYAILAGLSASIVRSAIACLLVLLVHLYYRKVHNLAALAVVFLINVLLDPAVIMDLGAQLSYTAVTGIILGAESLTKVFCFGSENKMVKLVAASSAVILLAQMAVLPVQLYHFWQASFLFLPANLIVDPLVSPITIIGFISSFVGLLNIGPFCLGSWLCQLFDALAYIPLAIIIYVTEKLSMSSLSSINTGQPSVITIIVYYLSFIVLLLNLGKSKHRLLSLILFLAALIFLFYKPDLQRPVLIFLPQAAIAINTHREAVCFGDENQQTQKILAFYGASLVSEKYDAGRIFRFRLCDKPEISLSTKEEMWALAKLSKELSDINVKVYCARNLVKVRSCE